MVGALERTGNVLRAGRLGDPDGIVAREAAEPPGEERLERDVPAILLADAITMGVRLTREVAMALTAFPKPGVVCSSANDGRRRASA